jgi:type I restriction enzyme S subunit
MNPVSTVPIGDLVAIYGGGTPTRSNPDYYGGNIPWVTPKDMKSWEITGSKITISQRGLEESATRLVPPLSVLLVVRSGVLKHSLPVAISRQSVAINQDMKALVSNGNLSPDYLGRFLQASAPKVLQWVRATTADNFPIEKLRALKIPLPPIEEQRRIASILDTADALRTKRRDAIAKLDTLGQSIFIEMFGDPVTNPNGWNDKVRLGDISEIVSGITKGRKLNGEFVREVPYLAVINVQDHDLNLDFVKTIEATEEEIKRYRLQKNDLLLTEGGDPDKLGRGTLWNEELPECIHQNHIFRVRLQSESINPLFLNWLVGSQRGKKYFLRAAKQTTGIASINMTQLRGFPLLIPPPSIQDEFSRRIAALASQRAVMDSSQTRFEALFASLQHRAFRGEL